MSEKTDKEIWKNAGKGEVWVRTIDTHTNKLKHTPVRAGAKVLLTTEERQINQDRAASTEKDMFVNGTLTPVRLVDTADDYQEIASNPNLLSEDDMKDILKLKTPQFKSRLGDITNAIALARMLEMAQEEESGLDITMAKFKALESRLTEIRGGGLVVEVTQTVAAPPGPKATGFNNIDF